MRLALTTVVGKRELEGRECTRAGGWRTTGHHCSLIGCGILLIAGRIRKRAGFDQLTKRKTRRVILRTLEERHLMGQAEVANFHARDLSWWRE